MKKNNKKYALKEMSKVRIIDRRSEKSIKGERDFLSILRHPFIVNMNCAFQDYENLYLVMDLLTGGDLRYHLCKIRRFSEEETKFFIACLLLGLEYIHNNNIIHRDIKPENLVSDENGYIRITDFGVAKIRKEDNSSETSGTPGYMAPEVLMAQNHSFPVDFFAIGIMGYEFMLGQRPYIGKNRKEIKHLVLKKQAKIDEDDTPEGWSLESVDFINKCLKRKESKRLGYKNGVCELKNHKWFENFDWEILFNKTMLAPFVPKKVGNYDKKYCEGVEKVSETTLERYQTYLRKKNFKHIFDGYTYINNELIQNTETLYNITTATKSNKAQIKTNSSAFNDKKNKLLNNNLHININKENKQILENKENNKNKENKEIIENKEIKQKKDNKEVIEKKEIIENKDIKENKTIVENKENKENKVEKINDNKKLEININNSNNKNNNNNKTNYLGQLNLLSFSNKEEKSKINSPSNSIITPNISNKNISKKDIVTNKDNSVLSLQKYLNYSKQKRIKFGGGNKNTFSKKIEQIHNKENNNVSNVSGLEPSTSLYNNNFKKIGTRNEEKKNIRSSSVCYSSNNNHENSNARFLLNKTNCINEGKTIDVNKINKLYNLINMTNKGSLSGRNLSKHKKINFKENFSPFGSLANSPKNVNRGQLHLKREFYDNINNPMHFCLPNLNGATLSPTFMRQLKLKGKLNLNVGNFNNQLKLKVNKYNKNLIGINYKKLINNKNKKPSGFKRSSSTSMFNQFMNNNNNIKKDISSKKIKNKNQSENKSNLFDDGSQLYNTIKTNKKNHNFSAIKF